MVSKEDLKKIIEQGDNEVLIAQAKRVGEILVSRPKLSTSQIRAIFGSVRRIELDLQNSKRSPQARREFAMLTPRLAYQAKKEGEAVEKLRRVLEPAIELVGADPQRFRNFVDFFEAILAYHRASGGSNN